MVELTEGKRSMKRMFGMKGAMLRGDVSLAGSFYDISVELKEHIKKNVELPDFIDETKGEEAAV